MKNLIVTLFLAFACAGQSAPALVGHTKDITGSSASSFNIQRTGVTAGNFLVIVVAVSDPGTTFGMSGVSGLQEDFYHGGGGSPFIEDTIAIWSAANVSAGSHTINVTLSDPDFMRWAIIEFSGVANSSYVIDTGTGRGFTSSVATDSITTAQNDTLLFCAVRTDGDETAHGDISAGSGYTLVYPFAASEPQQKLMSEYRVVNAGNYTGSFSMEFGDGGGWVVGLVAYAPAGGDVTSPTVTAFDIPSTSTSLVVPINTFTATDAVGVTGYLVNESASTPSVNDVNWSGSAQTSYTFGSAGTKTLYAWAKDAAGNVSTSLNDSVVITLGSGGSIHATTLRIGGQ